MNYAPMYCRAGLGIRSLDPMKDLIFIHAVEAVAALDSKKRQTFELNNCFLPRLMTTCYTPCLMVDAGNVPFVVF